MTRRITTAATLANPFVLWGTLAMKTMQMSSAAAQVIAIRTSRMAAAGIHPSEADRLEMTLMGAEKVDAFGRAGHALAIGVAPVVAGMAGQAYRTSMDVFHAATHLAASRSLPQTLARQQLLAQTLIRHAPVAHHGATAAARLAHRALEPVHAKATANAKRLTKKRPAAAR
jgi:hypothetical protein